MCGDGTAAYEGFDAATHQLWRVIFGS
jgi:hypothetical protein